MDGLETLKCMRGGKVMETPKYPGTMDHLIRDRSTAGCGEFRTGKEERE